MLLRNVSKNITRLRTSKNMSQKDLAEALFVSHQAVSKWEKGKSIPSIEVMVLLTELFEVSIDLLLSNPDDNNDFKSLLSSYDRTYCIKSLMNGSLDQSIYDVFHLLNKDERETVIVSIINRDFEVNIVEFWPLLNLKERMILLRGLIRNDCYDLIHCLKGMYRQEELALLKKHKKESMYEY